MSNKKNTGLIRRASGLMALEQRFMFDGAAVADAVDTAVDLQILAPSAMAPSANLARAEVRAEQLVTDFLKRPDAREQLLTLFKGEQPSHQATPEWQAAVDQLLAQVEQGGLNVRVEPRSAAELQGAKGAFSATGTTGEATIYLNADWFATADSESVAIVLTEELGHYLDHAINGEADTSGDEGERFARFVVDGTKPLSVSFLSSQDDQALLNLDGQTVEVELAAYNFVNAYEMVYDLDNDTTGKTTGQITTGDIDVSERWGDKEQNSHFFNATAPLGQVRIIDGTNNQNFSGNDVSAISLVLGGNTYYGWISRPIKANGVVRGFYFWTDTRFTNLAAAQADGNQDGDRSVLNNRGFLLVVDQTWFNGEIASTGVAYNGGAKPLINNTKDGNLGSITVANVGSSSDRVDSALNSLLVPNSAPVAANDTLTISEDSAMVTRSGANSLLNNDSDANLDALSITRFSVGGVVTNLVSNTGTFSISGAGTITIRADGSYDFTPAAGFSGAVPPITYTVSDGNGGIATAVLSISVTPVNDAPVSTNDARTVSPNSTVFLGLSDFGTYSDPDSDPLAKIMITSLPATGILEFFNGSVWAGVTANQEFTALAINSGQLRLTSATTDTAIGFKVSDGTLSSSAAYTLAITVPAAPATPTATADTGTGSANEAIEGVNGASGTAAAGNVLTNDTGTSIKVTAVFNTAVAAAGNTSIAGKYGTLTISATGAYSYAPNNTNAEVDALNVGGSLTENFSYTITDTNGNTATNTLTVKINGANDAPVARDDANAVKELAALTSGNYGTASGNVLTNDSDVDNSTGLKVLIETSDSIPGSGITTTANATSPITSAYFTATQTAGGNLTSRMSSGTAYSFVLVSTNQTVIGSDSNPVTVSRVGSGGSAEFSFSDTLTILDYPLGTVFEVLSTAQGSDPNIRFSTSNFVSVVSSSTTISLTSTPSQSVLVGYVVTGTNIPANTTVTAISGDTLTLSNAVQITNRSLTFTSPGGAAPTAGAGEMLKSGVHGYLRVAENGAYTYTLTSNTLNAGQTYTETFAYKTTDGTAQSNTATLRIVIDGTSATFSISAGNDSLTAVEDTPGTIANVLSNDPNTTTVTGYSWGNQSTTTAGTTLTLSGVGTLSITSGGLLTFTPAANYTGPVPTVTYTAKGAGTEEVSATVAISITSANDAPTGTDDVITIEKNANAILTVGDFGTFSDVDGNTFAGIEVTNLESAGELSYNNGSNWVPVTLNQLISATDIAAGKLRFTPAINAVGSNYATVGFKVFDGTAYSANPYTLTVNVIDSVAASVTNPPVNTVPSAQTVAGHQTLAFTGLSVNDVDNDITSTTLTVANGTLAVTGAGSSGQGTANSPLVLTGNKATIDALLATLVYTPTAAFSGADALRMQTSDTTGNTDTDFVSITVSPDTRALTVTGTTVNEASPYVYFQVAGVAGQFVQLELGTTGSGNGHALQGIDYLPNLEYFNGSNWVAYPVGAVTVPAGNNLLVRTGVLKDAINEGAETLKLIAKNTSGTSYEGNSTIQDDGTGSIFLGGNSFTADTSGAGFPTHLDDDRPVSVDNIAVNEASPWAMFTVSGFANQVLSLSLVEGTAKVGDGSPADGTEDYSPTLQYWNGTAWTAYNGTSVTMGGSTLLVRTAVHPDNLFEGQHTFSLGVTQPSSGKTVYGSASIYDDGTGNLYAFDNNNDGSATITAGPGAGFDDDRVLTINSPLVNEASDYAVFTLTGNSGQTVSLQLQDESSNGAVSGKANILENQTLKIWNGLDWVNYESANLPTFDANGKIFVRVDIIAEQDAPFEGPETFKLNATLTGRTTAVTGEATIMDDGTGVKFLDTFTSGLPTTTNTSLDDDRPVVSAPSPITVNGGDYNENSPRAVFTVNANPGQVLALDVQNAADTGKAPTGDNEGKPNDSLDTAPIYYSLNGGASWQLYTGPITAGNAAVLVAVDITNERDEVFEGEEQVKLVVTSGAQSASGYSSIFDDGTGKVSPAITAASTNLTNATNDLGGTKDNDKPQAVNDSLVVALGQAVTANIITRNDMPSASSQLQVRAIAFTDAFGVAQSMSLDALQSSSRTGYEKQVQLADGKLFINANGDTLYQHEGRRFLATAVEGRGVLEYNATGLANGWTTVAPNSSVVVSLKDIQDGRLRFTANPALTTSEATVAKIVEMDWRSDGFSYTMSDSGGLSPSSANVTYTVTGTETTYQAPVAPGSDADVDGITSRVESVLANRARGIDAIQPRTYVLNVNNLVASNVPDRASIDIGVEFDGDLNIDSPTVGDAYQNSVTTFSWINSSYFAASNQNPDQGDIKSIVTLVAENLSTTLGVPNPDVQLRGVNVLPLTEEQASGLRALVKFTPNWSPMGFSAEIRSDATNLSNIDTDLTRAGNQWSFSVDISRTGETTETFMGFVKWIDQATINAYAVAGLPLTTLDGQPITQAGWVDFTQRVAGGDGVAISNEAGNILSLRYTITDNALGDNDLRVGYITDPGMPVFFQRTLTVADAGDMAEGAVANFAVSLNAVRLLPTAIDLSLQDVTTDSVNGAPLDYLAQMEAYYIDASGNRQNLEVVNGRVLLPGGVATFNVMVRSVQDADVEGNESFTLTARLSGGANDSGSATIVDDDAPPASTITFTAPPVLAQAPVVTPPPPPPVNTPVQSFASALTPLAAPLVIIDPSFSLIPAITSGSGFQIPVSDTVAPGLSLFQGVTDQFVQTTGVSTKIGLPADAFIHSNKDAVIKLEAKLADNSNLPSWVKFDQTSGVFEVTPPVGFKGKIDVKVLARDDDGREAVAIFQLFVGEQTTDRPQSRESFTDKLRMAGKRPITLVRVADAGAVAEPAARATPVRAVVARAPAA